MVEVQRWGRNGRTAAWIGLLVVGLAFLSACGDDDDDESTTATTPGRESKITLRSGMNDPQDRTIAVDEYLPEAVTVTAGTTVEWTTAGPEPHSVTFMPGGQAVPPSPDDALFAPTPPTGPFDGTTLVNSGLIPQGPQPAPPFDVRFDTPGTYSYGCVIHPGMRGTVTVVAANERADNQAEVTRRGDEELNRWLAEGRAAKKTLTDAAPRRQANPDGTSTWTVEMGVTTAHTDVLAFAPVDAAIKPRDRVVFVNNSGAPHTASFPGTKSVPQDPNSPEANNPAPGPSPQTLNRTDYFNTGTLPPDAPPGQGPPLPVRSFTFVVPAAGDYPYVCIFHAGSAMAGTIKVA